MENVGLSVLLYVMRLSGIQMKWFIIILSMLFATTAFSLEKNGVDYHKLAAECYISSQDLSKILHRPSTVIIDTRRAENYRLFHIKNSLNIKLYQIQTKNYLKRKNLIIIGNTFDEKSMLKTCMKLTGSGYKHVNILKDGVAAWFKYDHPPENNKVYKTIYYLSPGDFHNIYFKKEYIVLNVSGEANSVIKKDISSVKVVTLSGGGHKLFKKIIKWAEKSRRASKFILVGKDGKKYKSLHKLNSKYADSVFFFLDKGIDALNKYEINNLIAVKKELKIGKVKTCSD